MVNKVILVGYVGGDPEIRTLESGVMMARLRLATSEGYFSAKEQQYKTHTEWHTVILWRETAEYAMRNVGRGTMLYVEGRLRSRQVEAAQLVEIVGDQIKVIGASRRATAASGEAAHGAADDRLDNNSGPVSVKQDLDVAEVTNIQDTDKIPF